MAENRQNKRYREEKEDREVPSKVTKNTFLARLADYGYKIDYYTTISILVGTEDPKKFTIHKSWLCATSKFFEAACSERCGGSSRAIKLPEISVRDFDLYFHWLYTSKIEVEGIGEGEEDVGQKHQNYLSMYILGDVLDDYQLRNTAMEHLIESLPFTPQPRPDTVWDIYERTPVGSPLRKLLVDWRIGTGDRDEFAVDVEGYPAEFVQELAVSLIRETPIVAPEEFVASVKSSFYPETGRV